MLATEVEDPLASLAKERDRLIARLRQSEHIDMDQVLAALEFGQAAHEGQFRKNGELYFVHPIRVAIRATEYDLDTNTLIGALLHDVIEDTDFTQSNIRKLFGPLVARLVEALTKVKTSKSLTLYKIFQLGNLDFRVILIKLLDRLDNLTDIEALPRHKQRRICQESLAIYSEVAHGLGLIEIEERMRNLIFKNLYTKRYLRVQAKLDKLEAERGRAIERITHTIRHVLNPTEVLNVEAVKVTPQSFFYAKGEVDRLLDHVTVEVRRPLDCYLVLGQLHTQLRSIPLSIRDFISNPRANGWRGLSTKLIIHGEQVAIQIVTEEFQEKNRKGLITLMKEGIYQSENYRQFFQLYLDVASDDNVRIDDVFRSSKERVIQCVTPGGDVIELRYGATILDFAFSVHSELGLKTIGGIINNTRYPKNKVLEDGMVVKVLTSAAVSADDTWLDQVVMPKSRREILKFTNKNKDPQ